jgi:hypothetical protein
MPTVMNRTFHMGIVRFRDLPLLGVFSLLISLLRSKTISVGVLHLTVVGNVGVGDRTVVPDFMTSALRFKYEATAI